MKKSILSKNIRKLRAFKNLNQEEFAELFEVSRAAIGSYEEGRAEPKLLFLTSISSYFNISLDDLVKKELSINTIARFNPDSIQQTLSKEKQDVELLSRLDRIEEQLKALINKDSNEKR